jgi:hypothetical protein
MSSLHVVNFCVLFIALASCNRVDPIPSEDVVKDKLLGKWQHQRATDETYTPAGVLVSMFEEIGTPDDSAIFKSNNLIYDYRKVGNEIIEEIIEYHIVNDSTINIDEEDYKIRKLTDTELYLHQEELDTRSNELDIRRIYLVR